MALSDIIYDFQTDPDRNKKILFFVAWAIIFMLLGYGIWAINQPPAPETTTSDTSLIDADSILSGLNTPTKFPESATLKVVSTKTVQNDKTFAANNNSDLIYVSSDNNLVIGNELVPNFPISAPLTTYPVKLGFIFNDYRQSAFVLKDGPEYKVIVNPPGIDQVVPLNTGVDDLGFTSQEEYYFMVKNDQGYTLKKSRSIQLNETVDLGQINTDIAQKGFYQMFRSRNTLLIAFFDNPSQQGNAQYWSFKNGKLTQFLDVADNWSTNVSENYLIITRKELLSDLISSYKNDFYELTSGDTPKLIDMLPTFLLRQQEIYGNMIARRCAASTNDEIYCLVKEKPVKSDNPDQPDIIISFNIGRKSASILASNKSIPSSSAILVDLKRQRVLVSNQIDKQIYELPI